MCVSLWFQHHCLLFKDTFGPSCAALFNEEYAFSLGFAAILLSLEAPNAGHVTGVFAKFNAVKVL